jgi:hypothetical protein
MKLHSWSLDLVTIRASRRPVLGIQSVPGSAERGWKKNIPSSDDGSWIALLGLRKRRVFQQIAQHICLLLDPFLFLFVRTGAQGRHDVDLRELWGTTSGAVVA